MPVTLSASCAVTRLKLSEIAHQAPEDRRHREHDQKELRIVVEHQRRRDEQVAELHRAHERHVLNADAHGVDVGGDAAEQAPDLRPLEEGHRHPQEVGVDLVPQIVHDGFAELERQP